MNLADKHNAAAMREALEKISLLSSAPPPHWKPIAVIVEIGKLADAALAATEKKGGNNGR